MFEKQIITAILIGSSVLGLSSCNSAAKANPSVPKFDTEYQAVLLDTGLVYYGKMTGLETDYPVLHDVYYIQPTKDPATNQVKNILVRRGNEWHGPAMTVLNGRHIVMVEPVGANSQVAQLIAEDKKGGQKQ